VSLTPAESRELQNAILSHRYDIASEILMGSGRYREARAVEAQLEHWIARFSSGRATALSSRRLGSTESGESAAFLVTFPGGVRGIFKPSRDGGATEVAVYRLNRIMGGDIVPVTVPFVLNGESGSLQIVVDAPTLQSGRRLSQPEGSLLFRLGRVLRTGMQNLDNSLSLPFGPFADGYVWEPELVLLDLLIDNGDRHLDNILAGRGFRGRRRIVAIDHTQSLSSFMGKDTSANRLVRMATEGLAEIERNYAINTLPLFPPARWARELRLRIPDSAAREVMIARIITHVQRQALTVIGAEAQAGVLRRLAAGGGSDVIEAIMPIRNDPRLPRELRQFYHGQESARLVTVRAQQLLQLRQELLSLR
jgi:hypothetical protein